MRERPLVYLVPPMAAALYAAVCLELPVQLGIAAPIALLLVLAAVFLRRHKCLLTVFAVLAAAGLLLTGFAVFRDLRVAPIRALAGETQEITAAALRDAEVYDTDPARAALGGDCRRQAVSPAVLLTGNRTAIAGRRQGACGGRALCAGHARRL